MKFTPGSHCFLGGNAMFGAAELSLALRHPRSMRAASATDNRPVARSFEIQRFPAGPAAEWVRSAAGIVARGGLMRDDDDKWSAVFSGSHGRGRSSTAGQPDFKSGGSSPERQESCHDCVAQLPQMAGRDRVVRRPPPAVVLFRRRPYGLVPGRLPALSRLTTTAGEAVTGFLAASAVAVSFVILGIVAPLGQTAILPIHPLGLPPPAIMRRGLPCGAGQCRRIRRCT